MSIEAIMSTTVVTVEMDDTLTVVKEIFDNTHFHHLLVVEGDRLFGVISDRDLLKSLSPNLGTVGETLEDVATLNKKAHQIMTRKPTTLAPDAGIYAAIEILCNQEISCIPVIDDERKPIGILSWRDILKSLLENRN